MVPASFKMDSPMDTAEAISHMAQGSGTSGINVFKKGQNTRWPSEERGEKSMWSSPANTKVNEEGGRGRGSLHAKVAFVLQHMERTMFKQISTLHPVEDSTPEQADISGRNCSLWRIHTEAGEMYEEEGPTERSNYRLTPNPNSPSPCAAQGRKGGRGVGGEGVKLTLENQR